MGITERTNIQWVDDLQPVSPMRLQAIGDLREGLERGLSHYLRHYRSELTNFPIIELERLARGLVFESIVSILDNLDSYHMESQFTTWAAKITARVSLSRLSFYLGQPVALRHSELSKLASIPADLTHLPGLERGPLEQYAGKSAGAGGGVYAAISTQPSSAGDDGQERPLLSSAP